MRRSDVVLDVGVGSGAVAVTLALESAARVYATDISMAALRVAAENAQNLSARVAFLACDLAACFTGDYFDMVASNPPSAPPADRPGFQRAVRAYKPEVPLFSRHPWLALSPRP